jgi:hypothetical protein
MNRYFLNDYLLKKRYEEIRRDSLLLKKSFMPPLHLIVYRRDNPYPVWLSLNQLNSARSLSEIRKEEVGDNNPF